VSANHAARAFSAAYDAMLRRFTMTPEPRDVATRGARTRVQVWGAPDDLTFGQPARVNQHVVDFLSRRP